MVLCCRDLKGKMLLEFGGADIAAAEPGSYVVVMTVTNALAKSASTTLHFDIAEAGAKPSVSVFSPGNADANGVVTVTPYLGLKLYGKLQLDSVCKGSASQVRCCARCGMGHDPLQSALPIAAAAITLWSLQLRSLHFTNVSVHSARAAQCNMENPTQLLFWICCPNLMVTVLH